MWLFQKHWLYVWGTQECGVFWLLLVSMRLPWYNQLANLYHGSLLSNVGHFCTLIVLNYPICEGHDYVYSMKVDLAEHVSVITVWESVCRTSIFVVKAYRNLWSRCRTQIAFCSPFVCWTVPMVCCILVVGGHVEGGGDGRLRYFALCSCAYKCHILAAPSPCISFPRYMCGGFIAKLKSHVSLLQVSPLVTCHRNGVE